MGILWAIVSAVFTGLIVGALARLIIPGTKGISIGMTIVIGIGGAIVGSLIYGAFGGTDTSGIDWIRLGIQVIVAAVFVLVYLGIAGKQKTS